MTHRIYFRKTDSKLHFYRREENATRKLGELAIEWDDLIRRFFVHDIPTEGEIEHAINYLEDTIMSRMDMVSREPQPLFTDDPELIALLNPQGLEVREYDRDAVEEMFSRYALLSMGRSPAYEKVTMDARKYAALLVIREILHHMNFTGIHLIR